jgi:hypothetical protein
VVRDAAGQHGADLVSGFGFGACVRHAARCLRLRNINAASGSIRATPCRAVID